jgi:hypothetical protein
MNDNDDNASNAILQVTNLRNLKMKWLSAMLSLSAVKIAVTYLQLWSWILEDDELDEMRMMRGQNNETR